MLNFPIFVHQIKRSSKKVPKLFLWMDCFIYSMCYTKEVRSVIVSNCVIVADSFKKVGIVTELINLYVCIH